MVREAVSAWVAASALKPVSMLLDATRIIIAMASTAAMMLRISAI